MIYQSDRLSYRPVMTVFRGEVNDVLICRDAETNRNTFYTLWVLKNHEIVKKLIRIMEASSRGYESCLDFFQYENQYCIVFPHVKERKLDVFYMSSQFSLERCTKICQNLVLQCLLSGLPYPLLYLVLKQEQIHLLKDYDIALGYSLDLANLDENIKEKDCAAECAFLAREFLKEKDTKKNIAYKLLTKKIPREGYDSLQVLYRDLKATSMAGARRSLVERIKIWWDNEQGRVFRLLLIVCLILLVFAGICLISRIVFGDVPLLRIFTNHFKQIGTESMIS